MLARRFDWSPIIITTLRDSKQSGKSLSSNSQYSGSRIFVAASRRSRQKIPKSVQNPDSSHDPLPNDRFWPRQAVQPGRRCGPQPDSFSRGPRSRPTASHLRLYYHAGLSVPDRRTTARRSRRSEVAPDSVGDIMDTISDSDGGIRTLSLAAPGIAAAEIHSDRSGTRLQICLDQQGTMLCNSRQPGVKIPLRW